MTTALLERPPTTATLSRSGTTAGDSKAATITKQPALVSSPQPRPAPTSRALLHGIWGLTAAKNICAALEEIAPDWVEDPILMDRISDVAELAASTRAPLAGGETLGGLGQFANSSRSGGSAPRLSM
jgi:hypothetical protein